MNLQTKIFPWLIILLLLSLLGNFLQFREAGKSNSDRYAENERLQKLDLENGKLQAEKDSVISSERMAREVLQVKFDSLDSVSNLKIHRLTQRIKAIDFSKSGQKELDSLIKILYK
jgi:hypothetical protein